MITAFAVAVLLSSGARAANPDPVSSPALDRAVSHERAPGHNGSPDRFYPAPPLDSATAAHSATVRVDTLVHGKDVASRLRRGIAAYHAGSLGIARGLLLSVFAKQPLLRQSQEDGTASFYLGKVLAERGEAETARNVWLTAIKAESELPAADVRSADAYVRNVFGRQQAAHYPAASETYLRLIQWVGDVGLDAKQADIVQRHQAQMAGLESALQEENVDPSSGAALASWWRSSDPKAATLYNERVIEHLKRVAVAEKEYPSKHGADGFDERGEIFVRLGAPTNQTSVDFFTSEMLRRLRTLRQSTQNHLQISPSDFADNEFWLYQHDDVNYYYLFVDNGNEYRVGKTTDLIPQGFMAGASSSSGRGGAKIDVILEALRAIYEQLARYHPDFGAHFTTISDYLNDMEIESRRAAIQSGQISEFISNRRRGDYSEAVQATGFMNGRDATQLPESFARRNFEKALRDAQRAAERREDDVPGIRTETTLAVPPLRAAMRIARFLNEDGTTRAEVFWGVSPAGETPRSPTPLGDINVTVNQYASDYRVEQHHKETHQLPEGLGAGQLVYPSEPVIVDGLTSPFHLKMQWDLRKMAPDSTQRPAIIRSATTRADSLVPLRGTADALEMSDVVPVLLTDSLSVPSPGTRFAGAPFPFERIPTDAQVGLYFEVYNLAYAGDDRTRYTVTYDVERRKRGGNWMTRIFSNDEITQTSASSTYGTSSRRTQEAILLDTSTWESGESVRVTVRVEDNVTKETYERSTAFVVGS